MDCSDLAVRLRGQEGKEVVRRLTLLDLPHRGPGRPDAGETRQRTHFVECEPDWRAAAVRQHLVLGKACERHRAAMLDPEPAPPMRRLDVADVGNARIGFLT